MRFLVLLALLVPSGPVPAAAAPREDLVAALEVLHQWDAGRARAWAAGDEHVLGSLYVRGSSAGAADVRLLRSYEARRVVVRRLVTQVFAVQLLRRGPATVRLLVLDRVAGGELSRGGQISRLPSSVPTTRVVELRRFGATWRVATVHRVSGSGPGPRAAPP